MGPVLGPNAAAGPSAPLPAAAPVLPSATEPGAPAEVGAAEVGAAEGDAAVEKKKRRLSGHAGRLATRIALFVLGTLVAIGLLIGALWLIDRRSVPVFPSDEVGTLPESLTYVIRFRADRAATMRTEQSGEKHEEAQWSYLAGALCGGDDLYESLMSARSPLGRARVARALDDRRATREALQCGKALSKKMGRGGYVVRFSMTEGSMSRAKKKPEARPAPKGDQDKEPPEPEKKERPTPPPERQVSLFQINAEALPSPPHHLVRWRDRSGLVDTRCKPESDRSDAICRMTDFAVARVEGTDLFVTGALADVQQLGRTFSPTGRNDVDHHDLYAELAKRLQPAPIAHLGAGENFDSSQILYLLGAGPDLKTPFPQGKLEYDLYKSKAVWGLTESGRGDEDVQLFLLTERPDDANDLAADIKEWHGEVKDYFARIDKPEDEVDDPDLKKVERDYRKARRAVALRSIKHAEIERDEKLVIVTFPREPNDEEQRAIEAMKQDADERGESAAALVHDLVEGKGVDEDLLRDLGGKKLVEAVKNPGRDLPDRFDRE